MTTTVSTTPRGGEARFWDRHAKGYARRSVPDQAAYEMKLDKTDGYLNAHDHVLEVGCGTGSTALVHAPRVARYLATDLSPRMIDIARRKAPAAGLDHLVFEARGIEELVLPHDSLDVVLAHNILHLVADVPAALAAFHALLKPGGLLIASVTCLRDEMAWFGYVAPLGHRIGLLPLINAFDRGTLGTWLAALPFEIVEDWQPPSGKGHYLVARKPMNGR